MEFPFVRNDAMVATLTMKNKLVAMPDRHYGPDHHIWDNNGKWWCHLSLARQRGRAKRIRFSLHTNSRSEARKRRDCIMNSSEVRAKALLKKWAADRS
ncbi:MAG: hypothetical protein WCI38_05305 [Chthoniobacterales bacterium]